MAPNNFHQKTTEKLSDFIKYSGNHDMSKCEKMRYADLLQEGILENMTTFLIQWGAYLGHTWD